MNWGDHYFDWKWVRIDDTSRPTVAEIDFTLEPSCTGSAEITVASPGVEYVLFALADDEGKVPRWTPRLVGESLMAKVKGGKATFQGLRPGKYVFYAPEDEWRSQESASSKNMDGRILYTHYVPRTVDAAREPPKLSCPAEIKAKGVTRVELK
jgi:hypothetical protein